MRRACARPSWRCSRASWQTTSAKCPASRDRACTTSRSSSTWTPRHTPACLTTRAGYICTMMRILITRGGVLRAGGDVRGSRGVDDGAPSGRACVTASTSASPLSRHHGTRIGDSENVGRRGRRRPRGSLGRRDAAAVRAARALGLGRADAALGEARSRSGLQARAALGRRRGPRGRGPRRDDVTGGRED